MFFFLQQLGPKCSAQVRMESQLKEYRARKAREKMAEERFKRAGMWTRIWGTNATVDSKDTRDIPEDTAEQVCVCMYTECSLI